MFRRLCGEDALSKVVLGTTNWGEVDGSVGKRREGQLADGFWKDLKGSTMLRFYQTLESARGFLDVILLRTLAFFKFRTSWSNSIKSRRLRQAKNCYTRMQVLEMLNARGISEKDAALLECVRKQIDELRIPLLRKIIVFFGITSLYSNFPSIRSTMLRHAIQTHPQRTITENPRVMVLHFFTSPFTVIRTESLH